MAGIYVHIPYCRKACVYCDFHFLTNLKQKGEMVAAIVAEAAHRQDFFSEPTTLETLYLGGGTPSVLSEAELNDLLAGIKAHFPLQDGAECTLEANPDDLTASHLQALQAAGVNRLSIGVQSFLEADLRWMNRSHNAAQALACVELARAAGIENISIDLIFGLPGRSLADWEANVKQAISLDVPHLSVYALTVEEKTALAHQEKQGGLALPEDQGYAEQFRLAHDLLTAAGYEHYELSNYAKPGWRSQHNSNYWNGVPYLGLGPAAHSYDGTHRAWNVSNNAHYLRDLTAGSLAIAETEVLSPRDRYHEYVMTHLRKAEGLDLAKLRDWFPDWDSRFAPELAEFTRSGWLEPHDNHWRCTLDGWFVSDHLSAGFFVEG